MQQVRLTTVPYLGDRTPIFYITAWFFRAIVGDNLGGLKKIVVLCCPMKIFISWKSVAVPEIVKTGGWQECAPLYGR